MPCWLIERERKVSFVQEKMIGEYIFIEEIMLVAFFFLVIKEKMIGEYIFILEILLVTECFA